jgi:hypothetical protein
VVIPTRIVPSVEAAGMTVRAVGAEFRALIARGARIRPAGRARRAPLRLLSRYRPKHKIELFDTRYYLTNMRQNPDIRFFVAYVVLAPRGRARTAIHPCIFYKDVSLVWRSASHFMHSKEGTWIGKGDVCTRVVGDQEITSSVESTTDLPLEMQTALETLCRQATSVPADRRALGLVLRQAPPDRIAPYRDFTAPRRRAAADRRNRINGGRQVASFRSAGDPTSLVFVAGFEPDFRRGIIETATSRSALYGGTVRRYRILSRNRRIQYLFMAAPRHVWITPPQATTTEMMGYGVRTVDVVADEDLFVPGYEYHFVDDEVDPPVLISQIPAGFAGALHPDDEARADASAWLDRLPIIREFRRRVLGRNAAHRKS